MLIDVYYGSDTILAKASVTQIVWDPVGEIHVLTCLTLGLAMIHALAT